MDNVSAKDASGVVQTFRTKDDGTAHTPYVGERSQPASTGNVHAPASNTDAVVTKSAPGAGLFNVCSGVYWSYDGDPTGGNITIEDNGSEVFNLDITAGGPGFFPISPPIRNSVANHALVATLAAGGSGVTGKLTLNAWTE